MAKSWRFYVLFCALLAVSYNTFYDSYAEDKDIVAAQWFDHLTYGSANTVLGIVYAGSGVVYNRIFRREETSSPGFRLDETGQQIVIKGSGFLLDYQQSSGAIHMGSNEGESDEHEAGHGKHSGLLGPLYLPITALDFLIEGYHEKNLMESWADSQMNLGSTMRNYQPLQLRLEFIDRNGKSMGRFSTNFVLLERASKIPLSDVEKDPKAINYAMTDYRYLKLGASTYFDPNCSTCVVSSRQVVLDASLYDRKFQVQWRAMTDALRVLLDGPQETGSLTVDFEHKRVDSKLFSHKVGAGIRIGSPDKLALDLMGRAGWALGGRWNINSTPKTGEISTGLMLSGELETEARAHLGDVLEIYAKNEYEKGSGGYDRDAVTYGVETPMMFSAQTFSEANPERSMPGLGCNAFNFDCKKDITYENPSRVHGGVEYKTETESVPDGNGGSKNTKVKITMFHVGGRF